MKQEKVATSDRHAAPSKWAEVYHRLETARTALEQRVTPTGEQKKAILRARAKALAYEPAPKEAATADTEVVEFLLAHERYGIESGYVREVYPLKEFMSLPCTPPFVLGIINLRGQIRSVIDLKQFFGLPETEPTTEPTDDKKVIILHAKTMEFGILADAVLGVCQIAPNALQVTLPILLGARATFLKGIANGNIAVLDAEELLSSQDLIIQEEVEV